MRQQAAPLLLLLSFSSPTFGWVTFGGRRTVHRSLSLSSSSPSTNEVEARTSTLSRSNKNNNFLLDSFLASSECDNTNTPPSLNVLLRSINDLFDKSGSDIRGRFVDHASIGSIVSVSHALKEASKIDSQPLLSPLTAYCIGSALAQSLVDKTTATITESTNEDEKTTIAIGRDPRLHGARLADALARGIESVADCRAVYVDLATTPACAFFCQEQCDAAVMVTASHLPGERNGFKLFSTHEHPSGYSPAAVAALRAPSTAVAMEWFQRGILPPMSSSGSENYVMCSQYVSSWMPDHYSHMLKEAIRAKVGSKELPLQGLKIVLNTGNGSGGFFHSVLESLGADVSASLHISPDGTFPNGIPNPEDSAMLQATMTACQSAQADLGIMLDTDADRCGFVVPKHHGKGSTTYEPLHRNRLIALLGVIFSEQSPGCAVVTDSVTSEGLTTFLQDTLGLRHVRYLKGYANVIRKARDITESSSSTGAASAELAIETSGHCAMRENAYLDDGTYTAVQVVSLLARLRQGEDAKKLLDLIADLEELDEVVELRLNVQSMAQVDDVFHTCVRVIEEMVAAGQNDGWEIDQDNLEGIRIRFGDSQFFMLRKSLHDPVLSLQVEARHHAEAQARVVQPLHDVLTSHPKIGPQLNLSALASY